MDFREEGAENSSRAMEQGRSKRGRVGKGVEVRFVEVLSRGSPAVLVRVNGAVGKPNA